MEPMTPDTSGLSSVRPFASYDRASRSWRTWTAIEASDSTEWSGTWPKTGCMSDGLSYRLPAWEPPTSASDSSLQSLPTPIVGSTSEASHGQISGQWRDAMTQALAETEWGGLLPTPTTSDTNGSGAHGDGGPDLRTAVAEHDLMPTPRAGDGEKGGPNQRGSSGDLMLPSAVNLLGTPTARDHKGSGQGDRLEESERRGQVEAQDLSLDLLPTPAVNDMGAAYTPDQWDAWTERMKAAHNNGNGHGASLNIEAQRVVDLLPTTTMDCHASGGGHNGQTNVTLTDATVRQPSRWGKYAAAIARWERVTRPAPEPTNVTEGYLKARAKRLARLDRRPVGMRGSLKVRRQLAARFSEWMMGVPLGWITDTPGITRNEALKAAGNGVVPQQAAEALRFLLDMSTGREIAEAHEPDDLLELLAARS